MQSEKSIPMIGKQEWLYYLLKYYHDKHFEIQFLFSNCIWLL